MEIKTLLILIPAFPLLAAILTAIFGPRVLREKSHWPVITAFICSVICSFLLLQQVLFLSGTKDKGGFEEVHQLWTWANIESTYEKTDDGSSTASGNQQIVDIPLTKTSYDFNIQISQRADTLTAIMLVMVTFISLLVAIYSVGYMHSDSGYWRFFTYISLFVFSMVMLVTVSNFVLLYVFWEAVGVCSYLLIGFWYQKPSASAAGMKAFLVNRVGDFGFALALFLIWTTYGTLNFHDTQSVDGTTQVVSTENSAEDSKAVAAAPGTVTGVLSKSRMENNNYVSGGVGLAICLLLLVGACGKSAQFPLHVWLPDAMEGPTPVSALIHAATMVTAGVYMVVRCTPLFTASVDAQMIVAVIGGITALMAGIIAFTQNDLKRVLAYSTISQLGYMFLALGTGSLAGIIAGMFHLFTHAFFKALLFLGAGSVMHSMGNTCDMRRFGGLKKIMPITYWTFLIGSLTLAGLPPLSGFWSKDAIVANVHDHAHQLEHEYEHRQSHNTAKDHTNDTGKEKETENILVKNIQSDKKLHLYSQIYQVLYYMALLTALLTAIYTFRAFFKTFHGEYHIPEEAEHHAHESPTSMTVPLVVLSVFAIGIGGFLEWTHGFLNALLTTPSLAFETITETGPTGVFHTEVAIYSSLIAIAGIAIAAYMYLGHENEVSRIAKMIDPIYQLSYNKFYLDQIYTFTIILPVKLLANFVSLIDEWIVDGFVNFIGRIPPAIGSLVRPLQNGLVQFYALAMMIGLLAFIFTMML